MTAAAPLAIARSPRPESDPRRLRDLLADAAVELAEHRAALAGALDVIAALTLLSRQRPAGHAAERRILGALLVGRASLRDVARLRCGDFDGPGHASLFALLAGILETYSDRQISERATMYLDAGEPSPALRASAAKALGWARRTYLVAFLEALAARFPDTCTELALDAIGSLPWPKGCPRDEIVTVSVLGAWSRGPDAMPVTMGFAAPTCSTCGGADTVIGERCWGCGAVEPLRGRRKAGT